MISLIQLLKEISSSPKAIIMAGGASVGKSTLLKSLENLLQNFKNLNADAYVEDKDSPMYGNLSAASNQIRKVDLPNSIKNQQNIIYDTTASNVSTLMPTLNILKDNGYDIMMIMTHAIMMHNDIMILKEKLD
jgi:predicted ABC-type ATPase